MGIDSLRSFSISVRFQTRSAEAGKYSTMKFGLIFLRLLNSVLFESDSRSELFLAWIPLWTILWCLDSFDLLCFVLIYREHVKFSKNVSIIQCDISGQRQARVCQSSMATCIDTQKHMVWCTHVHVHTTHARTQPHIHNTLYYIYCVASLLSKFT